MAEKYEDIKELFQRNDTCVIIDNTRKQEVVRQVKLQQKESSAFMTGGRILKYHICYMDKTILLLHMAVCVGIVFWGSSQHWGQICMIVSGALGALSLLEVGNMFFSKMAELGESCYFNVRQLMSFQMVYSGVLSLMTLLVTTVIAGKKYQLALLNTGLYIMVPFVFTACICMTVMLMETGRRNLLPLTAASIFSVLFWSVTSAIPRLYETSALIFWIAALAAGTGILTIQIRKFFKALDKGEIICADWN